METALKNAIAERDRLKAELKLVETFIANYNAFANGRAGPRLTVRGRPQEALAQIVQSLERAGKALKAREIIADCAANGYAMPGKVPTSYLAIIIHRNQNLIERLGNGRYALRRPTLVIAA